MWAAEGFQIGASKRLGVANRPHRHIGEFTTDSVSPSDRNELGRQRNYSALLKRPIIKFEAKKIYRWRHEKKAWCAG
jgi:hypothetical protein